MNMEKDFHNYDRNCVSDDMTISIAISNMSMPDGIRMSYLVSFSHRHGLSFKTCLTWLACYNKQLY